MGRGLFHSKIEIQALEFLITELSPETVDRFNVTKKLERKLERKSGEEKAEFNVEVEEQRGEKKPRDTRFHSSALSPRGAWQHGEAKLGAVMSLNCKCFFSSSPTHTVYLSGKNICWKESVKFCPLPWVKVQ